MKTSLYFFLILLSGASCSKGQDVMATDPEPGTAWLYPVGPTQSKTYICGSRPTDKAGKVTGLGSLTLQASQVFTNIKAALNTVGLTLSDVKQVNYTVKGTTSVIPDATLLQLAKFDTLYFGTPPSIIERKSIAKIVDDDILLEVEVIAGK